MLKGSSFREYKKVRSLESLKRIKRKNPCYYKQNFSELHVGVYQWGALGRNGPVFRKQTGLQGDKEKVKV